MYRALVHYYFKPDVADKGKNFILTVLYPQAKLLKCHNIELWEDEKQKGHFVGTGIWDSKEDSAKFKTFWEEKQDELMSYCSQPLKREVYKVSLHG